MQYNARMVCKKTMTKHETGITKKEGKMSKDRDEQKQNMMSKHGKEKIKKVK